MNKSAANLFLKKEVKIYPGDTYSKYGIVVSVDNAGVTFKITISEDKIQYPVGKLVFIAFSNNLTMCEA